MPDAQQDQAEPTLVQLKNALIARKEHMFAELTRINDACDGLKSSVKAEVFIRQVTRLERNWSQLEIEILTINAQLGEKKNWISTGDFETIVLLFNSILEKCINAQVHEQRESKPATAQTAFKPKLDLPAFDGCIGKWAEFQALYESLVHNNDQLSDVEKLTYLRTKLSKEPLSIISHYELNTASYNLAYKELKNRYDNKRRLGSYYVQLITGYKANKPGKEVTDFLEQHRAATNGLKALKMDDLSDFLLFELCYQNLPLSQQRLFDRGQEGNETPKLADLLKQVQTMARSDELRADKNTAAPPVREKPKYEPRSQPGKHTRAFVGAVSSKQQQTPSTQVCKYCKQEHKLYQCPNLQALSVSKRIEAVKSLEHCVNCLNYHGNRPCKSTYECRTCGSKKHHTLLHLQPVDDLNSSDTSSSPTADRRISDNQQGKTATCNSCTAPQKLGKDKVILSTIRCQVKDVYGNYQHIRAALDSCSETTIATTALARRLGLARQKVTFDIQGVTKDIKPTKGSIQLNLKSNHSQDTYDVQAVVLDDLDDLPTCDVSPELADQFKDLQLADPHFYKTAPVDLLLSASVLGECLSEEFPSTIKGRPGAVRTIFGWVIVGACENNNPRHTLQRNETHDAAAPLVLFTKVAALDHLLTRFWETEHVDYKPAVDPVDERCEQLFKDTHSRDSTGRYVVRLPTKEDAPPMGNNRTIAERSLQKLEKRLKADDALADQYGAFLEEYLSKGHMKLAVEPAAYLLIHHPVFKESTTTKLRVVFDGSRTDSTGMSLNDRLVAGPKLHQDIGNILMAFRFHEVAISADIKMMFRQILVHEDDQHYQHILWKPKGAKQAQEYCMTTVTYGLASSPYLAQRCLRQLVTDEGANYPSASEAVMKHCFMDDFVTGANSIDEAIELQQQLIQLLSKGGFELRKWSSSHFEVLTQIPAEHREESFTFDDSDPAIKILGLVWAQQSDAFGFKVKPFTDADITKRTVLSYIAKIHDILGFLNPIVFRGKHFMQQLWLAHLQWDDHLDEDLVKEWTSFITDLHNITQLRIPRFIPTYGTCRLIGFCDASEKGMAAVAYLQVEGQTTDARLLKAKSQVAPLKRLTINKLELGGAVLLAKLISGIIKSCDISFDSVHLFTDSRTVLLWLRKPTHLLKIYEANRVTQIHELTTGCTWRHVAGEENPADLNSRGASLSDLINSKLWWEGPDFLKTAANTWPVDVISSVKREEDESDPPATTLVVHTCEPNTLVDLIHKQSSLSRLVRVMAYVLRFVANCRNQKKLKSTLSVKELDKALLTCALLSQQEEFSEEFAALNAGKPLSKQLQKLTPYLDEKTQLIRVGGRLQRANFLPEATRHPVLLSKNSHLSYLVCEYYHKLLLHAGPRTTEAAIRKKFWITSLHCLVKRSIHRCIRCHKMNSKPVPPIMADIPTLRMDGNYAFENVSLDFGGPIHTKESNTRKSTVHKSYICLFVCLKTRAIHLEMVTDLSTPAFLAAFQRFTSRRNVPRKIVSDCGTNFQGASRVLKECTALLKENEDTICSAAAAVGTEWIFNAPFAPNFNGMAEAGIKSTKNLLYRQVGTHILTFEELSTLLCRIEAVLNSRPLTFLSLDPNEADQCYLTPGHFTTGRMLLTPPEEEVDETLSTTIRQRWRRVQQLSQQFWRTWSHQYLHQLMQRDKWTSATKNLQPGDLVYITGIKTSPLTWPLGRIQEVYPSQDGVVRVAKIRVGNGSLTRPINKLVKVPMEQ